MTRRLIYLRGNVKLIFDMIIFISDTLISIMKHSFANIKNNAKPIEGTYQILSNYINKQAGNAILKILHNNSVRKLSE